MLREGNAPDYDKIWGEHGHMHGWRSVCKYFTSEIRGDKLVTELAEQVKFNVEDCAATGWSPFRQVENMFVNIILFYNLCILHTLSSPVVQPDIAI